MFDVVITKIILLVFFETRCNVLTRVADNDMLLAVLVGARDVLLAN